MLAQRYQKNMIERLSEVFSHLLNTSLKLPVGVSPLQLVNLHRNRGYFVTRLHTWFCLSYFLKTNIKLYCIYQYFMSINSFFNTVCLSRYSRPITVTRDPDNGLVTKYPRFLCKFTSWSGETPTGNFSDVFSRWENTSLSLSIFSLSASNMHVIGLVFLIIM
jgi:hypothetical protein